MSLVEQKTHEIAPAGTWQADPVHSSIRFAVKHMGVSTFSGEFRDFDANLTIAEQEAILAGAARIGSVETAEENLYAHLQGPEFFDAERHPEARFVSSRFPWPAGEELTVDGALTLRGVTHPVVLHGTVTEPVTDPYGNERLGLEVRTTVDRTAFGLDWNDELPGGGSVLSNEVTLSAQLELVRQV